MWLLHLKNLKKLKLTWQKWNSSFKYEPNLTQREWGSIIVTRVLLWQSEVGTSLTRHKLLCQAAWREIWRGMKMAFLPFFSIKPASLSVSELARLGDYATAWKKQPLRITVSLCEKYMTAYALALATPWACFPLPLPTVANELCSEGLWPSLLHKLFGKIHISTSPQNFKIKWCSWCL